MTPAQAKIKRWRDDPVYFVADVLKAEPDKWQEEALRAFGQQDVARLRLSLQACAGPGKSAALAWMGWNFMSCYGEIGEHPKGAAVSITQDNLKDNLWSEFAKWQSRSEFLKAAFVWTKERIFAKHHPETWFISARSWSKSANPEEQGRTLSGLHSKYVLALVDESGDIPVTILKAGEQALSNCKFGRIVQAGNPISLDGMLHAAASTLRHQWKVIRITGDPDDPTRSPRIDVEWAQDQIKTYGRENPWVMAYVLGLFPPASINVLLGPDEVDAAMTRHLPEDVYNWAQKRLGVDVARFGDDRSVIFPRQGLASFHPVVMRHQRTTDIAARVAQAKEKWGSEVELVDDSGHWGHGVIDNLVAAGLGPVGILFEDKAIDPRYKNRRAEMWMKMAEWVKKGGALPNIPEMVRELTAPTYTFVNGQFVLEPKDQIKKRIGVSPDLADALALTFAIPDQPASVFQGIPIHRKPAQVEHEYNPFSEERMAM